MKPAHYPPSRVCLVLGLMSLLTTATDRVSAQVSVANAARNSDESASDSTRSMELTINMGGIRSDMIEFGYPSKLEQKYNFSEVFSKVLGCPIKDPDFDRDEGYGTIAVYAQCDLPLLRLPLTRVGTIDLQPIKDVQAAEAPLALTLFLSDSRHDLERCDPVPEQTAQKPSPAVCAYFSADAARTPALVHFEFGYSRGYILLMLGVLGFLLLIPVGLTSWFRRRAVRVADEAKPALSFAYRRFLNWTAMLGILAWWAAIDLLNVDQFVEFVLPFGKGTDAGAVSILPWALLWLPPILVFFVCLTMSAPMDTLRGLKHTQKQIFRQSFWGIARFALPISLAAFGVAELFTSPRVGVVLIAAAILMGKFATRKTVQAYGIEIHALTSGELRDRAFALAEKAKTKLNQLYVLPAQRMRMANAFAHTAQNILLTDYLIQNMSKAEVDAVVGHEVAHLQNKHLRKRMVAALVLVVAFGMSAIFWEWLPPRLPVGPIFYALLLLAMFFVSRRNEFAADAGSVKLTGDAEAMISALARLSRLNTMPMHWSKLDEKLLAHPSTLRRIKRLARDGGISEARTTELLRQAGVAPQEKYGIPDTALPAGKIFSTRHKVRQNTTFAWTMMLTTAVIPTTTVMVAQWLRIEGSVLWSFYLVGFVLTLAANLTLINFLPMRGLAKMDALLREKNAQGIPGGEHGGVFVSLAPDAAPRIYEGNWAWDLGFLSLAPEEFCYRGEEATFVLRREEITSIRLGPGPVGWLRIPSVYVSWRNANREGTFNIRPLGARSMREMAAKTRALAQTLEAWRRDGSSVIDPTLACTASPTETSGAPAFGQVTSLSPGMVVRGRLVMRDFTFNILVATGVMVLFGLGNPLFGDYGALLNAANSNAAGSDLYVLAVVCATRALVLAPYFWAKAKSSGEIAPTVAIPKVKSGT